MPTRVTDTILPTTMIGSYPKPRWFEDYNVAGALCLRELAPLSHILFGTDYPYRIPSDIVKGLRRCKLSENDWKAIGRNNALRLLPRLK